MQARVYGRLPITGLADGSEPVAHHYRTAVREVGAHSPSCVERIEAPRMTPAILGDQEVSEGKQAFCSGVRSRSSVMGDQDEVVETPSETVVVVRHGAGESPPSGVCEVQQSWRDR